MSKTGYLFKSMVLCSQSTIKTLQCTAMWKLCKVVI